MHRLLSIVCFITLATGLDAGVIPCLELRAAPYCERVFQGLPLLFELALTNTCRDAIVTYYSQDAGLAMEEWAVVFATNEDGRAFKLGFV